MPAASLQLLFGEVLGIASSEIAPTAAIAVLVIAMIALFFRPLLLTAISPDLAAAVRISNRPMEFLFLSLVALATAMALPVVGALLVFSLMVGPPAAARAFATAPLPAMLLSGGIALVMVWSAIALAYVTNFPIGFFVGVLAALGYGTGRVWRFKKA